MAMLQRLQNYGLGTLGLIGRPYYRRKNLRTFAARDDKLGAELLVLQTHLPSQSSSHVYTAGTFQRNRRSLPQSKAEAVQLKIESVKRRHIDGNQNQVQRVLRLSFSIDAIKFVDCQRSFTDPL